MVSLKVYSNDHDADPLKEFDLSMMIANFQQFYQFSVYPIVLFCVLLFRYLEKSSYYHFHRMAANRMRAFDPFDLIGIGFDSVLKAQHRGSVRSVIDLTDL